MTKHSTRKWTELASRTSAGIDVTLAWLHGDGEDATVHDRREGAYFEIPTGGYLPVEVHYHPFAHRHSSSVDFEESRLAA